MHENFHIQHVLPANYIEHVGESPIQQMSHVAHDRPICISCMQDLRSVDANEYESAD